MIQSTLADEHGKNRAIALTESNIVASIFAALAPLVVGFGATTVVTWRIAVLLAGALWLAIFVASHNMTLPTTQTTHADTTAQKQLPRLFWWYWVVMFLCVALEWVIFFWAADFLEKIVGLSTEAASSILSVFLVAIIIGRIIGSRLAYRFAPQHLLWLAIGLISLGFPFFWLGQAQWVNIGGLFVVGLGIANLFPMGLSIASKVGESASDLASSRVSLAAGLAIFLLPQMLGSLADFIGIFNAFGIVPVFIISFVLILAYANRQLGQYLNQL
jgi:fucose permease